MKKKQFKEYCNICENEGRKRVAKYNCNTCGLCVCKKCEGECMGECPECPPPFFVKF